MGAPADGATDVGEQGAVEGEGNLLAEYGRWREQAVLQEWAVRPPLPDTDAGRRLGAALDAFYAHAVAHGYDPEAEIPREPPAHPRTGRR
ncbi:hypothetical protein QFZ82_000317 [Streptomyces sp. V4I23]|uniref:hypothetical protein n=1 Tax=Streptomyces sp. V4I23 TaxID=3042282 RepID=UPI00278B52E4|nr:hypothetical protein [Streptomyces sp. V4I23]MDQ1005832.1 hypothetical protein [Streptomyces sp. V4I23]